MIFDNIIVGSGAGGASLAKALCRKGMNNLLLERGRPQSIGKWQNCLHYYDLSPFAKRVRKSKEGIIIWQSFLPGGSSRVSCGNIGRCLEPELQAAGIDLTNQFVECEKEINAVQLGIDMLGPRSQAILDASRQLGYGMHTATKGINETKCIKCGNCVFGCRYGAKWTAYNELCEAKKNGAHVVYDAMVSKVLFNGRKIDGVLLQNGDIHKAKNVIVCAGGINTPIILQKSGIKNAGKKLFCDLLVNVYGHTQKTYDNEPAMSLISTSFYQKEGFILSTYTPANHIYYYLESGIASLFHPIKKTLGLMVKIRDDSNGFVNENGVIHKSPTYSDFEKLRKGIEISKEILERTGDINSIHISHIQGAHCGGTCAINDVVDTNLETEYSGLYVSDASVLPKSPGFPPILTITALSRRLADHLYFKG
ncbi:MAG: GMC family oxidoreductase [Fibrobacter sp.]|nr:GMC family oxidoreductase [Fibrobacter sp.]